MEYADFYDIAEYGNANWKGNFTPKEIACNAYDYKVEYDCSVEQGKPTHTMIEMSECGFRIYESEEFGYFFGIDGAGYDFYESHWIPLYKARDLQWHNTEKED